MKKLYHIPNTDDTFFIPKRKVTQFWWILRLLPIYLTELLLENVLAQNEFSILHSFSYFNEDTKSLKPQRRKTIAHATPMSIPEYRILLAAPVKFG